MTYQEGTASAVPKRSSNPWALAREVTSGFSGKVYEMILSLLSLTPALNSSRT